MARYNLSAAQLAAVRNRDVLGMLAAGGNVYYLAKLAGILGLGVQDLGALQTGVSLDQFKANLLSHAVTETRVANTDGRIAA
jgi:protocatechuate 4,5-dioxygenase alpha chain